MGRYGLGFTGFRGWGLVGGFAALRAWSSKDNQLEAESANQTLTLPPPNPENPEQALLEEQAVKGPVNLSGINFIVANRQSIASKSLSDAVLLATVTAGGAFVEGTISRPPSAWEDAGEGEGWEEGEEEEAGDALGRLSAYGGGASGRPGMRGTGSETRGAGAETRGAGSGSPGRASRSASPPERRSALTWGWAMAASGAAMAAAADACPPQGDGRPGSRAATAATRVSNRASASPPMSRGSTVRMACQR